MFINLSFFSYIFGLLLILQDFARIDKNGLKMSISLSTYIFSTCNIFPYSSIHVYKDKIASVV
jgi:hypothetical protein